jgi:distribution and morphology protein 10
MPSPPTTLTLLYNPLMGFISSAYSAQVSPTVAISSRFGVNVYSYESDLSIGGEWWIGRKRGKTEIVLEPSLLEQRRLESKRAALQEASLREHLDLAEPVPRLPANVESVVPEERDGVLKARISGDSVRSLLSSSPFPLCVLVLVLRPYTVRVGS